MPREAREEKLPCIDSACYQFNAPFYQINIDISYAAGRPPSGSSYTKLPSYAERNMLIDGVIGRAWDYEPIDGQNRHISGILMYCKDRSNEFNLILSSDTIDVSETALRIFRSIQFNDQEVCGHISPINPQSSSIQKKQ